MDALETRELRYFRAVAEERHFGRAAERLGIAQPPLSRAIAQLERRLGVKLLERTSRRVALTPAGEALLHDAGPILDAVAAAARRAQRAGAPQPRLVVAMKADSDGGLLPAILARYEREDGAVPAELLLGGWDEQAQLLRDGRADVALLHTPFDARGLELETLIEEPRLVALAAAHRLANRSTLALADLAEEPLPRWNGTSREVAAYWCGRDPESGPGPRSAIPQPRIVEGPAVSDLAQLMRLVELGRTIAFIPASISRRYARPEIVYRPVADLSPARLVVAWPEASRSLAVAAFVRAATAAVEPQAADEDAQPRLAAGAG